MTLLTFSPLFSYVTRVTCRWLDLVKTQLIQPLTQSLLPSAKFLVQDCGNDSKRQGSTIIVWFVYYINYYVHLILCEKCMFINVMFNCMDYRDTDLTSICRAYLNYHICQCWSKKIFCRIGNDIPTPESLVADVCLIRSNFNQIYNTFACFVLSCFQCFLTAGPETNWKICLSQCQ